MDDNSDNYYALSSVNKNTTSTYMSDGNTTTTTTTTAARSDNSNHNTSYTFSNQEISISKSMSSLHLFTDTKDYNNGIFYTQKNSSHQLRRRCSSADSALKFHKETLSQNRSLLIGEQILFWEAESRQFLLGMVVEKKVQKPNTTLLKRQLQLSSAPNLLAVRILPKSTLNFHKESPSNSSNQVFSNLQKEDKNKIIWVPYHYISLMGRDRN